MASTCGSFSGDAAGLRGNDEALNVRAYTAADAAETGAMATLEITKDNFKGTIEKDGIVLLDWWAEWCGPCKRFGPIFEKASEGHPDVTFGKIDTEEQQELAQAFNIMSIPTLMIFRDRVLLFSEAGALPGEALEEVLTKVKALDMAEIHKAIAAEKAKAESPLIVAP